MTMSGRLAVLATAMTASGAVAGPIQPGQWETVTRVVHAEIPNAPSAMKEAMSKPHISRSCVTKAQADADPREAFKPKNGKCAYSKFAMTGGKFSSVMTCSGGPQGTMTVTSNGAFTPVGYTIHSVMVGNGPRGTMKMATDISGRRIGDCK